MKDVRVDTQTGSRTIETDLPPTDPWNGIVFKKEADTQPPAEPEPPVEEPPVEPPTNEQPPVTDEQPPVTSDEEPFVDDTDDDLPVDDETDEVIEDDQPIVDQEEEDEPNPYYYLSAQLKKDGFLLDDFEANEEVTGVDVYNAYRKKLESELQPQIEQQVYAKLQEQGVNENDLVIARAIRQGVDPSLLSENTMHERYASLNEDADRDQKINSIRAMYQSRNFKEKEIENLIRTATEDDDLNLDDFHAEAKEFHREKWNEFKEAENTRAQQQEQAYRQRMQEAENLVNKVLTEQEVFGEKMSEEEVSILRDAIYNPTDSVEWQGQKYSVTKLYLFDHMLQTDPQMKLWLFKKYLLRDHEQDTIKKKVKKEVEQDMLSAYEKSVKKDLMNRRRKQVKQQLENNPHVADSNKKTYTIDLG